MPPASMTAFSNSYDFKALLKSVSIAWDRFLNSFLSIILSIKSSILESIVIVMRFFINGFLKLRFKNLIANFNTLLKDFDIVLKNLRSKKGTLGKILFEDELYNNINDLIKDLKEHPWKLLRRPKKRYKKK